MRSARCGADGRVWTNTADESDYAKDPEGLGKNRLKHVEFGRDRRLRDGEEAALLQHANDHLKDVIVAALETGMRKAAGARQQLKGITKRLR